MWGYNKDRDLVSFGLLILVVIGNNQAIHAAVNYLPSSCRRTATLIETRNRRTFSRTKSNEKYPVTFLSETGVISPESLSSESKGIESDPVSSSVSIDEDEEEGGNPVKQMTGFVVDSFKRFATGTKMLYSNYQTCSAIRSKQKIGGSISFQEFEFLRKGKEDRSKVGNLLFLMVFSSSVLPYALMFFPEMMPSPFQPMDKLLAKYETLSRIRAHAILESLMAMENAEFNAPISSKFNPFSGGAVRKEMARIANINIAASQIFAANGLEDVFAKMRDTLHFSSTDNEKDISKQKKLMTVPKPIIKGIGKSIGLSSFFPYFMLRGKVLDHLKILSESDEFLVKQNVDLNLLDRETLLDACGIRFIGAPQSSDEELREGLDDWLKYSSHSHTNKEVYNENLGMITMLCYNAVQAIKDPNCESSLARLMFKSTQNAISVSDQTSDRSTRLWP